MGIRQPHETRAILLLASDDPSTGGCPFAASGTCLIIGDGDLEPWREAMEPWGFTDIARFQASTPRLPTSKSTGQVQAAKRTLHRMSVVVLNVVEGGMAGRKGGRTGPFVIPGIV